MVSIQLIVSALLGNNLMNLASPQVFDESILYQVFLHDAFYSVSRQISKTFILHQILDI